MLKTKEIADSAIISADKPREKSAEKSAEKFSERHKQIVDLMEEGIEYSTAEISALINLKGLRTRQLLKELADMQKITCVKTTKNRRYIKA